MFLLDHISYRISDNRSILSEVNALIPEGSMLAIMGLNGAGKTTLLKIMSGCLQPTNGYVRIDSPPPSPRPHHFLARSIAFVPQDFPTDFPFTVFEFVLMGRYAWQKGFFHTELDYQKVHTVLVRLSLDGFAHRVVSTLSGGERQRVLLARALVQDTPAILLDEPANHLDIKNKMEILELLRQENQKNKKTVIAVMHDFHDVRAYFDQVLLLKRGEMRYFGGVQDGMEANRVQEVFEVDFSHFPVVFSLSKQ